MTVVSPELQSGSPHRIGDPGDAPRPARRKRVGWFAGPSLGCDRAASDRAAGASTMAHTKAASSVTFGQIFDSNNGF
jgi:hypothetical protein